MSNIEPMSHQMRERVNAAIMMGSARNKPLSDEYLDQGATHETWHDIRFNSLFASYTPWGVACIEAAFFDRMAMPSSWDSKDLIRHDILTNPHLHTSIKERLLQAYEKKDWGTWQASRYDSFYAQRIMAMEPGTQDAALREEIQHDQHVSDQCRANLLLNLSLVEQGS